MKKEQFTITPEDIDGLMRIKAGRSLGGKNRLKGMTPEEKSEFGRELRAKGLAKRQKMLDELT